MSQPAAAPVTESYQEILEMPVTGTPGKRTPRSEFEMPRTGKDKEVYLIWDGSGSNAEGIGGGSSMTKTEWSINVIPPIVATLENDDAQAASEQAGGSSEKGGARAFVFAWEQPIVFEPGEDESDDIRDFGDLNSANVVEKLATLRDIVAERGMTFVMPALLAAETAYKAEFATPGGEHYMPQRQRPAAIYLIGTDGKLSDPKEFDSWLKAADEDNIVAVAVYGEGREHDAAVAHWQELVKGNPFATVVALTGVSDPREAAMDLRLLSGTAPGTPVPDDV
jgi:hypothetical protein